MHFFQIFTSANFENCSEHIVCKMLLLSFFLNCFYMMPKDIKYCQSIDNKMLLSLLVHEKYLDKACEKFSRLYYRYLDI